MIAIMSSPLFDALLPLSGLPRPFAAGRVLFQRGDPVRHLHLVVAGVLQLRRDRPSGAALVLQRAGAGDVLAEASLWSPRHHCDAVAATAAQVRAIPAARARAALDDPATARAYAAHLAREVRATRARAEILRLPRLDDRLDAHAALHGPLPPRGAWRGLADDLGVTPEALYRALARRRGPA